MSSGFSRSSHACSRSRHLSGLATFELEIARGLNRGSFRVQLALREAWVFERFVGTNLTAMWRWLPTGPVDADPAETRQNLVHCLNCPRVADLASDNSQAPEVVTAPALQQFHRAAHALRTESQAPPWARCGKSSAGAPDSVVASSSPGGRCRAVPPR